MALLENVKLTMQYITFWLTPQSRDIGTVLLREQSLFTEGGGGASRGAKISRHFPHYSVHTEQRSGNIVNIVMFQ